MKLDLVNMFVQVVNAGGFSAAARQTGIPRSTVSLQINTLENALGVRLLKRSTRKISLTDEGRQLFNDSSDAVECLSRSLSKVRSRPGILSGPIHLTAPADFPTHGLAHAITTFRDLHPEVHLKITLSNAILDLIEENVDIALRVEGGSEMDAVQRKLLNFDWEFCASAAWVRKNQMPMSIGDIADFISPKPALRTYLETVILNRRQLPPPSIQVENNLLVKDLVLNDFGVGLLPKGMCEKEITSGTLLSFLDQEIIQSTQLTLTFPTRADITPRVKIFADHLCAIFRGERS